MKMLKFKKYDVIIYDVSARFTLSFGMWNSFVMNYPCAKLKHDMTINKGINCIFSFFVCIFGQTTEVSVS